MTVQQPPQVAGHPFLGSVPEATRDSEGFYLHLMQTFGDISEFRFFFKRFIFVNHPDYIQRLLVDPNFVRSDTVRKMMGSFLGDGLFSQEGALHLQQRRLMQPAFHRKRVHDYGSSMVAYTEAMLDQWYDGQTLDVANEMMNLTLRIVAKTLFDSDSGDYADPIKEAFHEVQGMIDGEYPIYTVLPKWFPVIRFGRNKQIVERLHRVTAQLVQQRRTSTIDQGDLLSMLLVAQDEDGTRMTDEQVCGQVLGLLFAGHETSANALTWALYLLTTHPDCLAKVQAELATVLNGRAVTMDDLPQLSYLRMVLDETLRLYPPAWYTERMSLTDTQLGDYRIPRDTPLVVSVYATHRDPRYFPNPDQFDPERFSEANKNHIQRYTYMPFGAGLHQCMGNTFALMEMTLVLATILQRFTFQLPEAFVARPLAIVTMGMDGGLPITLKAR